MRRRNVRELRSVRDLADRLRYACSFRLGLASLQRARRYRDRRESRWLFAPVAAAPAAPLPAEIAGRRHQLARWRAERSLVRPQAEVSPMRQEILEGHP